MATVEQLLKVIKRYRGKWSLNEKIQGLCNNEEKEVASLLWAGRKEGGLTMEEANYLLHLYPGAPDAWDATDFCALVEELQQYYPDGEYTSGASGWCGHLPGSAWGIYYLLKEKEGDKEFGEVMQRRWKDLPSFWGTAVGYYLVAFGLMPPEDLPQEIKQKAARLYVREGEVDDHGTGRGGIPAAEWGRLLVEEASSPDDFTFGTSWHSSETNVLLELVPYATFDELLAALPHCSLHITEEELAALDNVGERQQIEEALLAQAGRGEEAVQPRKILSFMYLRRCKAEEVLPSPQIDEILLDVLNSESLDENDYEIALSALPGERLEALLVQSTEAHWDLYPFCPSAAIAEKIVQILASMKKDDYLPYGIERRSWGETPEERGGLLYPLRHELAPYALKALKEQPNLPQRKILYQILLQAEYADAAEVLVNGLYEKDKGLRSLAQEGIVALGVEAVLPFLQAVLHDRKKEARLAAAEVLSSMPPHAGLYELAQERLAKERTAAVKANLQGVRPPTGQENEQEALVRLLLESDGALWEEHASQGEALLEAFWWALADRFRDTYLDTDNDLYSHWVAALIHLREQPGTLERALQLLPAFDYSGRNYLSALLPHFPGLVDRLAEMLASPWPERPPEFGHYDYSWSPHNAVGWLEEQRLEEVGAALVAALASTKEARESARDALLEAGSGALPFLKAGLDHKKAPVRGQVIDLLATLRLPESLPALEAALQTEKSHKDKIKTLIASLRAAELDVEAFPETAAGDEKLDQALASLPAPAARLSSKLPALQWKTGAPLSKEAQRWFVPTLLQESQETREPRLPLIRQRLDGVSCQKMMEALLDGRSGDGRFVGNAAFVCAMLGGPELLDEMAQRLYWLVSYPSANWGRDAMAALAHRGSPAAIRALEWASRRSKSNTIRRRSGDMLETLASWQGVPLAELLDSAISDFGFNARGEKEIDYGGRPMTLLLDAENGLLLVNEQGKTLKTPPKARKGDDAEVVAVMRKEISALKKTLRQLHSAQKRRLEDSLAGERTWPVTVWKRRFVDHPIMRTFSTKLIWQTLAADGTPLTPFALLEEGTLIDLEMEEVALPEGGHVRLLHPLHLDNADERAAWQEMLLDQETQPLFDQLNRRTFQPNDIPPRDDALFAELPPTTAGPFMGSLNRQGYQQGPREDGGAIFQSRRKLGDYTLILHHDGYLPSWPEGDLSFREIHVTSGEKEIPWRETPPVLFSEIVLDLHLLTGT